MKAQLKRIAENLDVQTITASGSNPKVLIDAGIKNTEIFLAVTDSDEVNLVACFITISRSWWNPVV